MKNRRSVIISFLTIIILAAMLFTGVGIYYEDSLDLHFGTGEPHILSVEENHRTGLYYEQAYKEDVGENGTLAHAAKISKEITDEGIILLKNDGVLPLKARAYVTPLGFRFSSPIYGGTGSGQSLINPAYACSPEQGLRKHFDLNNDCLQVMKNAKVQKISPTEISQVDSANIIENGENVYEYESSIYNGIEDFCQDSVGIVFLGRRGGESANISTQTLADGTPHVLAITQSEKEMIAFSKRHCEGTVAVLNSSNIMQIGELMQGEYECDAILWIGGPGNTGFESLGDILVGEVNPSGRTVDIWDADLLSNPAQKNFCDIIYKNTRGTVFAYNYNGENNPAGLYYIEYEEGIYVGYKYYETAHDIGTIDYGKIDDTGRKVREGAVNYPFGYGLSYTKFTQKIIDVSHDKWKDTVSVTIEVENIGHRVGEEVVQLYYTPPYTSFDMENGVEKATKNLLTFSKVILRSGEKKRITLTFQREDMASYCMTYNNVDGSKGCYYLSEGNYELILGKNSHEAFDTYTLSVSKTEWYSGYNARRSEQMAQTGKNIISATNQFEDVTAYMQEEGVTILSRKNWLQTQPSAPIQKELDAERLKKVSSYDPYTDEKTGNQGEYAPSSMEIVQKQNNGLVLSDMRGRAYNDPLWEDFLNQIDYSENAFMNMLLKATYHTSAVESIGKPRSLDKDGPQGLKGERGSNVQTFTYCTEVVLASTFDTKLAYGFGQSIGNEALLIGLTGWYGPGLNIHRSPFCGRNYEYYSEDARLSGKMAASCISGAASRGVISYVKHFAMNNYEGPATCLTVWATEQTIRETYLRSFEIAIKEATVVINYYEGDNEEFSQKEIRAATGIMGAANCIGTEWCAANYNLLENVLRGEWGFQGVVTTDMMLQTVPGNVDKLFRSGGDLRMYYGDAVLLDGESFVALSAFRRATKNICYAYANSNLMQNIVPGAVVTYSISPWKIVLIVFDVLIVGGVIGLITYEIAKSIRKSKIREENPQEVDSQS